MLGHDFNSWGVETHRGWIPPLRRSFRAGISSRTFRFSPNPQFSLHAWPRALGACLRTHCGVETHRGSIPPLRRSCPCWDLLQDLPLLLEPAILFARVALRPAVPNRHLPLTYVLACHGGEAAMGGVCALLPMSLGIKQHMCMLLACCTSPAPLAQWLERWSYEP